MLDNQDTIKSFLENNDKIKKYLEGFLIEDIQGFSFNKKECYEKTAEIRKLISKIPDDKKTKIYGKNIDIIKTIKEVSKIPYSIEDILDLEIVNLLYKLYKDEKENIFNDFDDQILRIYNNEILKEKQYNKYKLIEINKDREIFITKSPYIYDKNINYTEEILNTPKEIVKELQLLYKDKKIGQLSFKIKNGNFRKGRMGVLHEALEYGKLFNISDLGKIMPNKLYDDNYNDALFINSNKNEITFEELCETEIMNNDEIITQVVHFKYKKINNDYVITHFDHEYIFYTKNEYKKRKKDAKCKGHKKIKSFKADKCNIPITYKLNSTYLSNDEEIKQTIYPFFYYILLAYFKHKNLLTEYFSKCM